MLSMTTRLNGKLNQLQKELPEGLLVDAAWLEAKGYSSALRSQYVRSGWLNSPARRVYRRSSGSLTWQQVVISLQTMLDLPLTVGGRTARQADVRIIAATHQNLRGLIAEGRFREDLYYRLNVVPIHLPPLRERHEDIGALVRHFLGQAANEGLPARQANRDAIAALETRDWRGNVRELRNAVFRLALMAREDVIDRVAVEDILPPIRETDAERTGDGFETAVETWIAEARPADGAVYHAALAAFEKPLFELALDRTEGNQLRAARLLGINRNTLRKRLSELDIAPEAFSRRG